MTKNQDTTINTLGTNSCETFVCRCNNCFEHFQMGCCDVVKMKYCPLCGIKLKSIE